MKLDYSITGNTVIIYLHGHVDIYVTAHIEKECSKLITSKSGSNFIINMSDVDYVSSSGLGVFISIMGLLKKNYRELAFCNMDDDVRKIFEIVKLTEVFNIFNSEDDALEFLKKVR